jgi:hypothetical protein
MLLVLLMNVMFALAQADAVYISIKELKKM